MTPAKNNRTLILSEEDTRRYANECLQPDGSQFSEAMIENRVLQADITNVLPLLPASFVDLLIIDPPYNLRKNFNGLQFGLMQDEEYASWFRTWFVPLLRVLKPDASVYICTEWRTTPIIQSIAGEYLRIRNRITWEREKGKGAMNNWKNCSEDILFLTHSDKYVFNVDSVKLKRKVLAPYRSDEGKPKDWEETADGNFRSTHPSNLWTDISVPFWSMPENTEHPTQKPEKLIAKLILASSNPGDFVFDPFLGSGTTAVTAKKLNRRYCGVEIDQKYAALSAARLVRSEEDTTIQGYDGECFYERNTLQYLKKKKE